MNHPTRQRLRILTWHVHGNYLYYLSQVPHDFYLVTRPPDASGRVPPGYAGKVGALPWVSLTFAQRTGLAVDILTFSHVDYLPYYALAALPFLAFHTAGHLHTADAVRQKHPGLATIRFPQPDPDGLWRFPTFSYRRRLARLSPRTTPSGSPA